MIWLDSSREAPLLDLPQVYVAGHGELLTDGTPDEGKIKRLAASRPAGTRFIIDIENLTTVGELAIVKASYRTLDSVAKWINQANPELSIGLYGVPSNTYWPVVKHMLSASVEHAGEAWYLANAGKHRKEYDGVAESFDLFLGSLLPLYLDFVCPSLYAPYCDIDAVAPSANDLHRQWEMWSTTTILLCRQLGMPAIPFIWHRANAHAYPFISQPFWRQMLATVRGHADGAVLWRTKDREGPWVETLRGML